MGRLPDRLACQRPATPQERLHHPEVVQGAQNASAERWPAGTRQRHKSVHLVPAARQVPAYRTTDRVLPGVIGALALSARSVASRRAAGVARQPPMGREAGAHGHNRAQNRALPRPPWSPERSVQTLCRSARPASTSGFTGASSGLEPRPSPFSGDALPGSTATAKCHLSRAFERTTGFEPATLTLGKVLGNPL